MGVVYKALDTGLGRTVALKFLPSHLNTSETEQARFLQEAKAASALNHPNVCNIHSIGEHEGQSYIDMEFIDGQTLRKKIAGGALKPDDAIGYAIQIGEALHEAHTQGIVHRDIKSENIMVNSRDQIKVMDFGLAKLKGSLKLTKASSTVGTLAYMAPEQMRDGGVDGRSDIFSFGVVLFEMLTGRLPFRGEHDAALMYSILNEDPEPLTTYYPEASPELLHILRRALEKDPADRYQHVDEIVSELRRTRRQSIRVSRPPTGGTAGGPPPGDGPNPYEPSRKGSRQRLSMGMIAVLVVAVTAYFLFFASTTAIDSLAVLPFVNASNDPDSDYLSDGITESLINNLSQLSNLTVMSRSSVFQFKGKGVDPQQAGKTLGVKAVLAGRVMQRGDDLVISTELVNVSDNSHIWGEQYNRKMADVLLVQNAISQEISNALSLKLGGEEERKLAKRVTEDTEAYQLYLKGRFHWNKRTLEDLNKALSYFQQAIEKDPNYALAHLGLAETYSVLPAYGDVRFRETYQRAKDAAQQALKLDPSLGEAYATIASVESSIEWNWKSADENFKRAIALKPNYASAHQWYAEFLAAIGRPNEAEHEILRAQELDPLSLIAGSNVGWVYYLARRYDDAITAAQNTLQLDPNFGVAHSVLAIVYQQMKRYDLSIEHHLKAEQSLHEYQWPDMAVAYAAAGQEQKALEYIRRMKESPPLSPTYSGMAMAYAALGDKDKAFAMLDKAYEVGDYNLSTLKTEARFDPLRSDPRFRGLLKKMNLEDEGIPL